MPWMENNAVSGEKGSPPQDQFNGWGGGRGCSTFVPVLEGNSTKIAPTGDIFDQPTGQVR